ncbi:NlpC/P60 family protein [Lysobacter sp. TY2-98]|uniref:C40 family peptidase n=1 Tax=Lysobacter sp. TY2-98 TaxID=2290922 RepID=UPI000E208C40|nr:C40 family peptidase [Lysobacter sp. TY2-98]AXK72438.1 NlpC/P60 family protein [Lysobacter sp. TY2-98]
MTGKNFNRSFIRAALAAVLALAAIPAFADPATTAGMGADSADAPSDSRAALPESMSLSDRALMLASDINRLIVPGSRPANATATPVTGRAQSVLARAFALLGTPYRWGGTSTEGFDCSGLVGYVFRNALGVELPRVAREQAQTGMQVERSQLTAGDLVFFSTHSSGVDHVGIYIGDGKFLHAPRTGRDVTVSQLDSGYWNGKFVQARRVAGI